MHKSLISFRRVQRGQKLIRKCAGIFENVQENPFSGKVLFDTHNVRKYNIETRAYIAI